jgi:hypothetical protein
MTPFLIDVGFCVFIDLIDITESLIVNILAIYHDRNQKGRRSLYLKDK